MKINRVFALSTLMLMSLLGSFASAQSDLAENRKAVACIDIRFKQLFEGEMAKTLQFEKMMDQWSQEQGAQMPFAPDKLERFFGAVSAPESVEDFMRMQMEPGDLPFDFFVVLQLADEASMEAMIGAMPFTGTVEKNGQTFYLGEPEGVLIQRKNPTTLAMGTESFLLADGFKDTFSGKLKETWEGSGDAPIRLAVDMETPVELLREVMEMSKQDAPPMFAPMIDVIDNAESITIAIDPDAEKFFAFQALGIDEGNAEELRGTLDGLLGMAKMGMNAEIANMKDEAPKIAEAFQGLVDSLRATGEGLEVNITLKKPDGFEKAIGETIAQLQTAARYLEKKNRFRQVLLSVHIYESENQRFPFDPEGIAGVHESLSWRLLVLPYLESNRVYERLDVAEAVDSETNKFIVTEMPPFFGTDGENTDVVMVKPEKIPSGFAQIVDGTSMTIAILEYPEGVAWAERNDVTIDEAVELFKSLKEGDKLIVGFYDGSVRGLKAGIDEELLRKLLDPADGQTIEWDELERWSD